MFNIPKFSCGQSSSDLLNGLLSQEINYSELQNKVKMLGSETSLFFEKPLALQDSNTMNKLPFIME